MLYIYTYIINTLHTIKHIEIKIKIINTLHIVLFLIGSEVTCNVWFFVFSSMVALYIMYSQVSADGQKHSFFMLLPLPYL